MKWLLSLLASFQFRRIWRDIAKCFILLSFIFNLRKHNIFFPFFLLFFSYLFFYLLKFGATHKWLESVEAQIVLKLFEDYKLGVRPNNLITRLQVILFTSSRMTRTHLLIQFPLCELKSLTNSDFNFNSNSNLHKFLISSLLRVS